MASSSPAIPVDEVALCTGCRRPLDRVGPRGECLRCLSGFVWSPDTTPAVADANRSPATVGTTQYGQFEVIVGTDGHPVELGAGAMAVTYRARDTVLHFEVALKVINRTLATHPDARARFLREARAAARLRHPNVASVFQYGEQGGECFYAMELVEGEDLEAQVRREGPLPVALALEVGVQVARALAAAEACGVIHRDLKPSNLMLAGRGAENGVSEEAPLVKVIDWGLARAVSLPDDFDSNLTRGGFVGTPAFASPEQFRGGGVALDSRSDIYSLGITLWYLLCGRVPFAGRSLEEARDQRATGTLPLEQLAAARVPGRVVALLKSMLAVDPVARPRSARELLEALRRCQGGSGSRPRPTVRNHRRWWLLTTVVALGCALIVVTGAWWWHKYAPPSIPPLDRSVAVLPFENLSPEAADAFFTTGVQDQIAADLARVASLKVIGPDSTRLYPPKGRDLARIGQELGAAYLLEGSVRRTEGRVAITVRLVDAKSSTRAWANQYDRQLADVFAVQSEITRTVADRLEAPLTLGERTAVDELPTSDLVAYDFFLRARDRSTMQVDEASDRQEQQRRIALLEKAVARDPNFFLAYCDLVAAHDTLYLRRASATAEEQAVDHRAIAESILATARRLRPDAGELHLVQANHFRMTNETLAQARIEIDLARHSLPNDAEVENIAGMIASSQGRWQDSIHSLERAVVLEPRDESSLYELAQTYRSVRHYEAFERTMARLIAVTSEQRLGSLPFVAALGAWESRGDTAPMRAALATPRTAGDPEGQRRDFYSIVLHLGEHDADALSRVLAASSKTQFLAAGIPHPKAWYEGLAARLRGDQAGAHAAFAVARLQTEKLVLARPASSKLLSILAMIDAGLGRAEALDEAKRVGGLVISPEARPGIGCNVAVVYAWMGQPDLAFAELNKWVDQPASPTIPAQPTYGDFRLNPVWDPLRSDPRFETLVQRLAPKE